MNHRGLMIVLICLALTPTIRADQPTQVLMLFPRHFGANSNLISDKLDEFGWQITTTGVTRTVIPCQGFAAAYGMPAVTVDLLVTEIDDITAYDCLIVVSTERAQPSPCSDITGSQAALDLISAAVDEGLAVAAYCVSVRALAAADVVDGIRVQGPPEVSAELQAAGAIYLGSQLPPVIDGNIITCSRGQYYNVQNCEALGTVLDSRAQCSPTGGDES